jgi:MFS family permease
LSVLGGIAGALDMPARQSLIPYLVEREDLMNAIALNSAAFNGARIVGPGIAGLVLSLLGGQAGSGWIFALNAVSYLAVLVPLITIPVDSRPDVPERQSLLREVEDGVAFAWRSEAVRAILGLLVVAGVFGLSYTVLMPVFARDVLGADARGFGVLLTASGVGATIGALAMASATPRRPGSVLAATFGSFALLVAAFAMSPLYWLSAVLMVGVNGTLTAYFAASNTTIQAIVPDALRGRVISLYILAVFGTAPLGGLLIGWLASTVGAQAAVLICAIMCAAAVAAFIAAGQTHRLRVQLVAEGQP